MLKRIVVIMAVLIGALATSAAPAQATDAGPCIRPLWCIS